MSINNKPHSTEPVVVAEKDSFGNTVFRMTDPWLNYFDSVDGEINISIVQNINNTTTASTVRIGIAEHSLSKLIKEIQAMRSLMSAIDVDSLTKELKALKSQVGFISGQVQTEHKHKDPVFIQSVNEKQKPDPMTQMIPYLLAR